MRLAIVSTHPIQYNAPFFRLLGNSSRFTLHVFYTWEQAASGAKYDPGFGKNVEWDIPLLEGYSYTFLKNIARKPGSDHFTGIVNPDIIKTIEAWKPDILIIYGWSFQSHMKCLRYFHGKIPVWFRGDSTLLDEQPGVKKHLRRIFLRWMYKHVDKALFVGSLNKEYFLAHGLKNNQLYYLPHAIDNLRFSEPAPLYEHQAKIWRKELGISTDDKVILFAGKLEAKKNPFFLLELAQIFSNHNIWWVIAGNGPLETALKAKAVNLKRVLFLDFQNQKQMPVLYRLGDVFVLPSAGPGETWGLAVNEAMACGRPVMVSDRCGCAPDLVKDGKNGFVFQYDNASDAAHKLQEIFNRQNAISSMGEESLKIIQRFSVEEEVRMFNILFD